jgi:hypothetical protein
MSTARVAHDGRSPADALLPRRRRGSEALGVALVVGLLGAAWFSPQLLRPRLTDVDEAMWSAKPAGIVETAVGTDVDAWPWLTLTGVDDVPAARVVSVTVKDGATGAPLDRIREGDDAVVVVRWQVTDCGALDRRVQPVAHVRGTLGTTTTQRLPAMAGPAFDVETLRSSGTCPGG